MSITHFIIRISNKKGIRLHTFKDLAGKEYEDDLYTQVIDLLAVDYELTAVSVKEFFLDYFLIQLSHFIRPSRVDHEWKIVMVKSHRKKKKYIIITQSDSYRTLSAIPIEDIHRLPVDLLEWDNIKLGHIDDLLYKKTKNEVVLRTTYHKNLRFFDLMLHCIDYYMKFEKKKRFY